MAIVFQEQGLDVDDMRVHTLERMQSFDFILTEPEYLL